jgi:hypothetical protein
VDESFMTNTFLGGRGYLLYSPEGYGIVAELESPEELRWCIGYGFLSVSVIDTPEGCDLSSVVVGSGSTVQRLEVAGPFSRPPTVRGATLFYLGVRGEGITDTSWLRDSSVGNLVLWDNCITTLVSLATCRIGMADISYTQVRDVMPLAKTGIRLLDVSGSPVTNVTQLLRTAKGLTVQGPEEGRVRRSRRR